MEGRARKGPEFHLLAPVKFYMPLVVTGQALQFPASLSEKEAEQTVQICTRNLMQKEAHQTPSKVVGNPQKDVGFKLGCLSLEFAKG